MLRKILSLLLLFGLAFVNGSCQNTMETKARQTVETFIKAWQQHDVALMEEIYPGVKFMDFFYSSDEAIIVSVDTRTKGQLCVKVTSTFVTKTHQEVMRRIIFMVIPDQKHSNLFRISDSYGLACWERYPYYHFAIHTGCIPARKTTSDVELAQRMIDAKQMVFVYSQALYDKLSEDVHIIKNTMLHNDGKHSEGVALVINESQFHLPGLQYSIIFYNEAHKEVGRHKGWVTHDILPAGDVCAFNYDAEIMPGASLMYFVLDFDVEMIVKYILEYEEYSGNEYEDFRQRQDKGNTASAKRVSY